MKIQTCLWIFTFVISISEGFVKISMIFAKNRQIQTSQYLREIFIAVLFFGENFACLLFAIIIIIPYCSAY
jgi:hypothetical protein